MTTHCTMLFDDLEDSTVLLQPPCQYNVLFDYLEEDTKSYETLKQFLLNSFIPDEKIVTDILNGKISNEVKIFFDDNYRITK